MRSLPLLVPLLLTLTLIQACGPVYRSSLPGEAAPPIRPSLQS